MGTLHSLNPTSLPPGTEMGPWRVLSRRASGSYGTVYRVERVGLEADGHFALKLATLPRDPRFEREAELLSRLSHPHVPRLRDRGSWELPGGVCFPYLVMDWVEGTPLYEWAAQCPRTSREVLRLLAQLASAVAATHAEEGVHRDVKGDNALVLEGAGTRAMLVDFGSASIRRAPRLTWQQPPPGTPQYWSPECQRFQLQNLRNPSARYEALPADDVYALGVTAYRLVTGTYPPAAELEEGEHGHRLVYPPPVPPERLVSVCPELSALILQMLSFGPADRGSAEELAHRLEYAARTAGPAAEQPIQPLPLPAPAPAGQELSLGPADQGSAEEPAQALEPAAKAAEPAAEQPIPPLPLPEPAPAAQAPQPAPPRQSFAWVSRLVTAASVALAISAWWPEDRPPAEEPVEVAQEARDEGQEDAGTSGLADIVLAAPVSAQQPESDRSGVSLEMPKEPLPGQRRPPCAKHESKINGGCWGRAGDLTPPCDDYSYAWKGGCYWPIPTPPRPPTSEPP